mgnify:CR=1 FL=1
MAATPVPASQFQQLRILAGFTQAGLSDLWGVHRVTIARWESGALPVPAWATRLIVFEVGGRAPKEDV